MDSFIVMSPYMLSNNCTYHFQVLATHSEGPSTLTRQKTIVDAGSPLQDKEGVFTAAFNCPFITGDVLRFVTYFMFDHLSSLVLIYGVYLEGEALQCVPEGGQIPQGSRNTPDAVVAFEGYSMVTASTERH